MWIDTLPEAHRVDDDTLAAAYDATGDTTRAWLKTTMALVRARFGESPERQEGRQCPAGSGFAIAHADRPVDWVAVLVDDTFQAAVRLCAAVMVGRLAGAGRTVALLQGTPAPAVLTALELLGVEDLFALSPAHIHTALTQAGQEPHGRLLCFGRHIARSLPEGLHIPARADRPPRVRLAPDVAACPDCTATLRAVHPDAVFVDSDPDVAYSRMEAIPDEAAPPLRLHPDLCGAWLYPYLNPTFFTVSRLGLAPVPPQ